MIFSRFAWTGRRLAASRVWPLASARVINCRLVAAWRRWMSRNSGVVWKSGQVRQALGVRAVLLWRAAWLIWRHAPALIHRPRTALAQ